MHEIFLCNFLLTFFVRLSSLKRLSYELNVKVPEEDVHVYRAKNKIKAFLMHASTTDIAYQKTEAYKVTVDVKARPPAVKGMAATSLFGFFVTYPRVHKWTGWIKDIH